jgi:excisionase family DNA binding protein
MPMRNPAHTAAGLHPVPSLDAIAADPLVVGTLAPEAVLALRRKAVVVLAALADADDRMATVAPQTEDCRFLSVEKIAARLDVPESYVYELARRGQIPSVRIGKRYVRFSEAEIDEWLSKLRNRALYKSRYFTYSRSRGGKGATANSKAARAHASGPGGQGRSGAQLDCQTRARRARDPGISRTAAAAPSEDRGEPQTGEAEGTESLNSGEH